MEIRTIVVLSGLLFFIQFSLRSQDHSGNNSDLYQIHIRPTTELITIDGDLSEAVWTNTEKIENFWQTQPIDGVPASHITVAYITYDERNIYVGAICYDDMDKNFIRSLKRDDWGVSDEFGLEFFFLNEDNFL